MLANKVSPASLCSNTNAIHPEMNLVGHSLTTGGSGAEESQQSQASLFNSGSELANSMELFSQPYTASSLSSTSQHSQTHSTANMTGAQNTQDDGGGVQNIRPDTLSGKHPPQSLGGQNKYYMRYLSAVSLSSKLYKRPEACAVTSTPLAGEGKHRDTVHSKAAFETWKSKQQERLEKQQLLEEVIKSSSDHVTKELNQTLENVKKEIKEVLSLSGTNDTEKNQAKVLTQGLVDKILLSQTEIKEQLVDLKALCSQQNAEIASLQMKISMLERAHTTTLQSTLSNEMTKLEKKLLTPFLQEFKVQVSQFSEQMKHKQSISKIKEEDSGLGGTQADCTSYHSTPAASTNDQSNGMQIKRKQKNFSVTDGNFSQSLSTIRGSCSKPEPNNTKGVELALSQSSTEGHSTPCDTDLTQHSPSGCSQVISQQLNLHYTATSQTATKQKGKRGTHAQTLSPSCVPVAKKRRPTSRIRRQKATTVTGKRKATATPRATRCSRRLRKPTQKAFLTELVIQKEADSSDEDVQCMEQSRALPVDGQRSVTLECSNKDRSVDIWDDWLDFQPTKPTPDKKPTSQGRFQRSSEAARRRLVVTEQMSSALEGSDSVLRELFLSAPSVFSP